MDSVQVYEILKEIVSGLKARGERISLLPDSLRPEATLEELGVDLIGFSEVVEELKARFRGKDFHLGAFMVPDEYYYLTSGRLVDAIASSFKPAKQDQVVVYVDDEEENLFVLKRKFGKRMNLKTFTDSSAALEFIRTNESVGLVITDEVMPNLSGNQLCDEVHKTKPLMKFILITGNPNNDDDLMYRTLRRNRFYEFFNKPMDFDNKGEEYFNLIQRALASEL
jgi:CheY-like chemotaxis protein